MRINLNQLAIFYLVGRHKKMAEVAKILCVSTPAVTMQIKNLECWLGFTVFYRERNSLQLTENGQALYAAIEPLFCDLDALERYILDLIQAENAILRLGTHHLPGIYFIPDLISHVQTKYPKLKVQLELDMECRLLEDLIQNKLDVVLVAGDPPNNECYKAVHLFDQDLVLVAATGSKLGKLALAAKDLADVPLILPQRDSGPRRAVLAFLSRHDVKPNILLENLTADVIKKFLPKMEAASFIIRSDVQKELDEGLLQEIPFIVDKPPVSRFCFVYMEAKYIPIKIKNFLACIEGFSPKFRTFA